MMRNRAVADLKEELKGLEMKLSRIPEIRKAKQVEVQKAFDRGVVELKRKCEEDYASSRDKVLCSGNIWTHSGNIQASFKEHSGNIQGTFRGGTRYLFRV
jgi:hypothetical protein